MKKTKIVFFDIDHTLYDPIHKHLPDSTIEAVKKLSKKGDVHITVATGRAYYMLDIIEEIMPYIDSFITINGQIVMVDGTIIHDQPMQRETIETVKRVFDDFDLVYGCIGKDAQAINRLSPAVIDMFEDASMPCPMPDPNFNKKADIYQMWAFADDETFNRVSEELKNHQLVPWLTDGFDVVLGEGNKQRGAQKIMTYLNMPLTHAYAFGDGDNDIKLLEYIPHSYAMGNAKEHVKKHARYRTDHYQKDGIKKGLIHAKLIEE